MRYRDRQGVDLIQIESNYQIRCTDISLKINRCRGYSPFMQGMPSHLAKKK